MCGYNLTCVGDTRAYSYVRSRDGNSISDFYMDKYLKKMKNFKKYEYIDRGSDERQYCSQVLIYQYALFQNQNFIRNITQTKIILKL